MSLRNCPSTVQVVDHSSATSSSKSPALAPSADTSADFSESERNFATGESSAPASPTFIHTRPLAPSCLARSVSWSSLLRPIAAASGYVAASTRRPLMHPAEANALNPVPANTAVSSTSSIPKRRSGLSDPKRFIASCHVMRSIGGGVVPVAARAAAITAREIASSTSSLSTKLISASSCVNSYCRSARRSSSRKQRAIW